MEKVMEEEEQFSKAAHDTTAAKLEVYLKTSLNKNVFKLSKRKKNKQKADLKIERDRTVNSRDQPIYIVLHYLDQTSRNCCKVRSCRSPLGIYLDKALVMTTFRCYCT